MFLSKVLSLFIFQGTYLTSKVHIKNGYICEGRIMGIEDSSLVLDSVVSSFKLPDDDLVEQPKTIYTLCRQREGDSFRYSYLISNYRTNLNLEDLTSRSTFVFRRRSEWLRIPGIVSYNKGNTDVTSELYEFTISHLSTIFKNIVKDCLYRDENSYKRKIAIYNKLSKEDSKAKLVLLEQLDYINKELRILDFDPRLEYSPARIKQLIGDNEHNQSKSELIQKCYDLMNEASRFLFHYKYSEYVIPEKEYKFTRNIRKVVIFELECRDKGAMNPHKPWLGYGDIIFYDKNKERVLIDDKEIILNTKSHPTLNFIIINKDVLVKNGVEFVSIQRWVYLLQQLNIN